MTRIGLIGVGNISAVHLKGYSNLLTEKYDISLEAYCDLDASKFSDKGGRGYTSIDTFMEAEQGKLDMVDICLPTYLHASAAIKALRHGFNVIVEKPMALNYADALAMCEAAVEAKKTLMVAQCLRFSDEVAAIRRYVEDGTFGSLKTADVRRDFGKLTSSERNWFIQEALSGGAILDVHVHDIDWMQSVFGKPAALSSGALKVIPGDGYDIVSTNYYYPNGVFTHCTGEWTTNKNIYCGVQQLVKFDSGYIIHTTFGETSVFQAVSEDGTITDLAPEKPHDMYTEEIRYFIDCISAGIPVARCLPESTAESIRIASLEIASADGLGKRMEL